VRAVVSVSKMVQVIMYVSCVWQIPGVNNGWNADFHDSVFHGFSQLCQVP
jgi:hypothetical protein